MSLPTETSSHPPAHQLAYLRLREMVLFGDLPPGAAVTIEGLVARLELGMTPVREAIRRLIAEGALTLLGNRRVCVPRLSAAAVSDLGYARTAIETRLAQQAMARSDDGLIAQLQTTDHALDRAIAAGDIPAYLRLNHDFHFQLYARAGSDVLMGVAASLWLQVGPSLRVVCHGPEGTGALGADGLPLHQPDNHKRALDALATGNAPALAAAIADDIAQGVANICAGLQQGLFDQPARI
jgi:DNA-binding GntR family transcriptional regulator